MADSMFGLDASALLAAFRRCIDPSCCEYSIGTGQRSVIICLQMLAGGFPPTPRSTLFTVSIVVGSSMLQLTTKY